MAEIAGGRRHGAAPLPGEALRRQHQRRYDQVQFSEQEADPRRLLLGSNVEAAVHALRLTERAISTTAAGAAAEVARP